MTRKKRPHVFSLTHSYCVSLYSLAWSVLFFLYTRTDIVQVPDSMMNDISTIHLSQSINKHCLFVTQPKHKVADAAIPSLPFQPNTATFLPHDSPDKLIEHECFLQFGLVNNADTADIICFTPGYFCRY